MNRRLLSVTVFLALMLTSLLAGRHNYHVTRNEITADLHCDTRHDTGIQAAPA